MNGRGLRINEAATIRNRAKAAARALRDLLAEKTLPKELRTQVEGLNTSLAKTWKDLEDQAGQDEPEAETEAIRVGVHFTDEQRKIIEELVKEEALTESANIGQWFESRVHLHFTQLADDLFGEGRLTREERIALSNGIGSALDAFVATIGEKAGQLYQRGLMDEPQTPAQIDASESAKLDSCVAKMMDKGSDESAAYAICRAALGEGKKPEKVDLSTWNLALEVVGKPKQEAATELDGDFVQLTERSLRSDGTIPVKIIAPGWGSSGFYAPEVLERDGPKAFTPGVKMYWNHPTPQEERERPERDLRDLAAELVSAARWSPDHPAGPGLYADAKVFEGYRKAVEELAPHIGVSIRALGRAERGNAEGKAGPIIKEISSARSVDFVTTPGAGGQVLQLFEARRGAAQPINDPEGGQDMSADELAKLQEANAALDKELQETRQAMARYQEAALLREAGDFVAKELAEVKNLPDITRERLRANLSKNPPVKDGRLDGEALKASITEAVKAEMEYITSLTGGGQVRGMGASQDQNEEAAHKSLVEAFVAAGLTKEQAEIAAVGR